MLFCQREAAETAIFLTEVAGRHGYADWRRQVDEHNAEHNRGLPRLALKMATGSGKTVVMAMLIAWHTSNKVASPRDARFAKRFLVVTPGITIRDRFRVLHPEEPVNYYDQRDLVPPDLKGAVAQAQIVVTNYHAFLLKDVKEIKGVAAATRKLLRAGKAVDVFTETPDAMVSGCCVTSRPTRLRIMVSFQPFSLDGRAPTDRSGRATHGRRDRGDG